MSHTPAPWKWMNYPDGRKLLVSRDRAVIHCPDAPMTCDPDDARLIAAAPELLQALKGLVGLYDDPTPYDAATTLAAARQAITKAEGAPEAREG